MTGPGPEPTASPPPPAPALPETPPVLSPRRAGTPLPAAAPHPPHRLLSGTPPVGCPPAPGRSDRAPRFVANDHSSFLTRRCCVRHFERIPPAEPSGPRRGSAWYLAR